MNSILGVHEKRVNTILFLVMAVSFAVFFVVLLFFHKVGLARSSVLLVAFVLSLIINSLNKTRHAHVCKYLNAGLLAMIL